MICRGLANDPKPSKKSMRSYVPRFCWISLKLFLLSISQISFHNQTVSSGSWTAWSRLHWVATGDMSRCLLFMTYCAWGRRWVTTSSIIVMEKLQRWKAELLVQNEVGKIRGERETGSSAKDQKKGAKKLREVGHKVYRIRDRPGRILELKANNCSFFFLGSQLGLFR